MDQQGNIQIEHHNFNKYISNNPSSLNGGLKKDNRIMKNKGATNTAGKMTKMTSAKNLGALKNNNALNGHTIRKVDS